ncbi:DUF5684 domain-containing protein [Pontiellaceae bacterium B12219]|nr:DUF5684 domain-containing protein [Pontiellaceae bacterium B12219]
MESDITYYGAEGAAMSGGVLVLYCALIIISIVAMWKVFTKAGHPGWASIVPIYNTCVMCDIGGKPMWWVLLMFIPVVNIVVSVLVTIGIAKNFGRGTGTVLGLIFLPFIFLLILGFGSAEYNRVEG